MCGVMRSWPTRTLRNWLSAVEDIGELKTIKGAEPKEEIGGIVDLYQRKMGNPAVMFDEVPGFPKGHRVLANILTSVPRINVALGLAAAGTEMDLIRWWRNYMRDAPTFKPSEVNGGPLLDNVLEGNDGRPQQNPDADLARARRRSVHRNRLHGGHEGPGLRLDQLRRLSRADRTDPTSRP